MSTSRAAVMKAERDPALTATVLSRAPLRYAAGADPSLDRPAHVRAGSGLTYVGSRIAVVQDDTNFLALVDPARPGQCAALTLPVGPDGGRQFGDSRGNKRLKLDLEACVASSDEDLFVAFGSGSTPAREVALVIAGVAAGTPEVRLVPVPALYARLREAADFSGSELNVEGALLLGGTLRLFARGNGATRDGRAPVNATCDLRWDAIRDHLADPARREAPMPREVQQYALGALDGVPLGFTDAAAWRDRVLYTAAAEASPDAVRDGDVAGSAIGIIDERGVRWAPLSDRGGATLCEKIEGIVIADMPAGEAWVVADPDDEDRPSELWRVRLDGPWRRQADDR